MQGDTLGSANGAPSGGAYLPSQRSVRGFQVHSAAALAPAFTSPGSLQASLARRTRPVRSHYLYSIVR
jgi:hypothetical protein